MLLEHLALMTGVLQSKDKILFKGQKPPSHSCKGASHNYLSCSGQVKLVTDV